MIELKYKIINTFTNKGDRLCIVHTFHDGIPYKDNIETEEQALKEISALSIDLGIPVYNRHKEKRLVFA